MTTIITRDQMRPGQIVQQAAEAIRVLAGVAADSLGSEVAA